MSDRQEKLQQLLEEVENYKNYNFSGKFGGMYGTVQSSLLWLEETKECRELINRIFDGLWEGFQENRKEYHEFMQKLRYGETTKIGE